MASITGFCSLALPGGFSKPTAEAPLGVPIGYELLGRPDQERLLLALAETVSDKTSFQAPLMAKGDNDE
ncbi:MAG TPA: hypothetical protein GXZ74_07985 [Tissierellia bacterium]|nr:hypothetical protein [Tissierellia bacterium]